MNNTIHLQLDPLRVIFMNAPDGHASLMRHIETLLHAMEHRIMTRIKDYGDRQTQFNSDQSAAVDAATASVVALSADIQALNAKIVELQNSPGQVSPEDGELINRLEIDGAAVSAKVTALADALRVLDTATPPVDG